MNNENLENIANWLQTILDEVKTSRNQMVNIESQLRALSDEGKMTCQSTNQRVDTVQRTLEKVRSEVEQTKSDIGGINQNVDGRIGKLESTLGDIRNSLNDIKGKIK